MQLDFPSQPLYLDSLDPLVSYSLLSMGASESALLILANGYIFLFIKELACCYLFPIAK